MLEILSLKKCSKCKHWKSRSKFYKKKSLKDGLQYQCKDCMAESNKEWRSKNASAERKRKKEWRENNLERDRQRTQKWRVSNKEKLRDWWRRYRAEHLEQARATSRNSAKRHPEKSREYGQNRRARKKQVGGKITAAEWQAVLEKYGHKCVYPGCRNTDVTMDHVKPISLGGTHTIDNVQPLCKHHNVQKHAKHVDYRPF